MSKPALILIGAGGHAHSCIDVIEEQDRFEIAGLVGFSHELNARHLGYVVIGTNEDLPRLINTYQYALIATGQIHTAESRIRLYYFAKQLGFQMPPIVAPSAYVSRHASIGPGTIIMHGAIINAGVNIGENCIINSRALIEHDVNIEDNCHISTGAVLNGGVVVHSSSFIGSHSAIKQGVIIGASCVVGMGSIVHHDLDNQTKFIGLK